MTRVEVVADNAVRISSDTVTLVVVADADQRVRLHLETIRPQPPVEVREV
jgi:hypothetical protein